jgi:MFS family permease
VFDRIGNIFVTALVGIVGLWSSQRTTFYLIPLFAFFSALAVLSIPAASIDHERARGFADDESMQEPEPWWRALSQHRGLLVIALTVAIFHFANAPMLPLAGQKLSLAHPGFETALLAACILIAQLVSMPIAILVGLRADTWGRKPLLVVACVALMVRGAVFAWFDSASILLAAQVLDGISAGILDVLIPLVLADTMRGTGRYSLSRGVVGTVQGVGGSLSNVAAGAMVVWAGYGATFAALAAVASIACILVIFAVPETARGSAQASPN